jgi:hypothetical protein
MSLLGKRSLSDHQWRGRKAGASLELVVSGVLLVALVSVVARVSVACGRLWQESRSYRLASSELSNQMERLTLLNETQLSAALSQWQPEAELLVVLPEAKLTGQVTGDADGKRLTLSLTWKGAYPQAPLTLVGWLIAPQSSSAGEEG